MAKRVFKESQGYVGTWVAYLIILLEVPVLILLSVLFYQAEDKGELGFALTLVVFIMGSVFLLIFNIKLQTRIDETGVAFKFTPFINQWRKFNPEQIRSVQVIRYSPITDYGGWGLKGNSKTKVFSILGDEGLLLDIGEKKKIMIGTARGKELREFVENWKEEHYGG